MFNSRCSRICWAADRYDEWPSTSSVTSTCKSYRKGYANSRRSADLIKGTRMVISILTFSTPGTSMAWMPANPWVSRLHQRINNRKKNIKTVPTMAIQSKINPILFTTLPCSESNTENPVISRVHIDKSSCNHLQRSKREGMLSDRSSQIGR